MSRKLTLVAAPAGFGKTTLIWEWLRSEGFPPEKTVWISLTRDEEDPFRFLDYIMAGIKALDPELGREAGVWAYSGKADAILPPLTLLLNPPGSGRVEIVEATKGEKLCPLKAFHLSF